MERQGRGRNTYKMQTQSITSSNTGLGRLQIWLQSANLNTKLKLGRKRKKTQPRACDARKKKFTLQLPENSWVWVFSEKENRFIKNYASNDTTRIT